jgi:hypothetical protein
LIQALLIECKPPPHTKATGYRNHLQAILPARMKHALMILLFGVNLWPEDNTSTGDALFVIQYL